LLLGSVDGFSEGVLLGSSEALGLIDKEGWLDSEGWLDIDGTLDNDGVSDGCEDGFKLG